MKKKLFAVLALSAVMAASASVFADEAVVEEAAAEEEIMLISEENSEAVEETKMYDLHTVTVMGISENMIETTTNVEEAENYENTINFTFSENTVFYAANGEKKSAEDVKEGTSITVYTPANSVWLMIMPPQYSASVVVINDEAEGYVSVGKFLAEEEMLVNEEKSLALNIGEETVIVDTDENEVEADLDGKELVVFYSITTRSIPPQTTPEKVVVLQQSEVAEEEVTEEVEEIEENGTVVNEIDVSNWFTAENGTVMVPLREVAESLDFVVSWNGEERKVTLNDGMYSLKIDENAYIAGKMMAVELGSAPVIVDDYTYVPVEFFTELLEVEDGVIVTE